MPNKRFYEKYANASLKFFYGENHKNFVLAESPDLQNEKDNIGVEVTRGISEYEGRLSRLANECMEQNLPLDKRVTRANKMFRKNFLGMFHENLGFVIADPSNSSDCGEIHVRHILEKIKIKTDKPAKSDDDLSNLYEITVFRSLAEENYEVNDHLAISGKLVANNFEKDDNLYYNTKLVGNSITVLNN